MSFHPLQHCVSDCSLSFKSIRVVECREFRDLLLLLRSDLKDHMIPHRVKVWEMIIETWRRYFVKLRHDINVSPFNHLLLPNIRCPECCGRSIIHS
jgi:hypothetical protein